MDVCVYEHICAWLVQTGLCRIVGLLSIKWLKLAKLKEIDKCLKCMAEK